MSSSYEYVTGHTTLAMRPRTDASAEVVDRLTEKVVLLLRRHDPPADGTAVWYACTPTAPHRVLGSDTNRRGAIRAGLKHLDLPTYRSWSTRTAAISELLLPHVRTSPDDYDLDRLADRALAVIHKHWFLIPDYDRSLGGVLDLAEEVRLAELGDCRPYHYCDRDPDGLPYPTVLSPAQVRLEGHVFALGRGGRVIRIHTPATIRIGQRTAHRGYGAGWADEADSLRTFRTWGDLERSGLFPYGVIRRARFSEYATYEEN